MSFNEEGIDIEYPGKHKKFVEKVQQITFNGKFAAQKGQEVLYVTERAVFKLTTESIELIEIAPGVDLEKDVLAMMDFTPIMVEPIKTYDANIFKYCKLGLLEHEV